MQTLAQVVAKAADVSKKPTVAVACAADTDVLKAVESAVLKELASFQLFDDEMKLTQIMQRECPSLLNHKAIHIVHEEKQAGATISAVNAVSSGRAQVLMKGNLPTAMLMKEALRKENGLRTGTVLSHVAVFEIKGFDRLFFITDSAMNLAPDLETKAQIIRNAVTVAQACGRKIPVVAPLAAIESVNPAMQATLDAAALTMMNQRGQLLNCIVEGPLALDNAISLESAHHKKLTNAAAGNAEILVAPNLEAGNILYKSLTYFANAKVGGIIQGATAPIVVTSRADSAETKLHSLALALLVSQG